jgi:hypothetical protein
MAFDFLFDGRMRSDYGASDSWKCNPRGNSCCTTTHVDNLDWSMRIGMAIRKFMGLMERGYKVRAGRNA